LTIIVIIDKIFSFVFVYIYWLVYDISNTVNLVKWEVSSCSVRDCQFRSPHFCFGFASRDKICDGSAFYVLCSNSFQNHTYMGLHFVLGFLIRCWFRLAGRHANDSTVYRPCHMKNSTS